MAEFLVLECGRYKDNFELSIRMRKTVQRTLVSKDMNLDLRTTPGLLLNCRLEAVKTYWSPVLFSPQEIKSYVMIADENLTLFRTAVRTAVRVATAARITN
jgi:hypothetical protein